MPLKPIKYKSRLEAIKTDAEKAFLYSIDTKHDRWPAAEPYILKNPHVAIKYAAELMPRERWPELEKIVINEPYLAYRYALINLDGRWPEAEPTIMKDAESAYFYAYNVLQKRWPAAEKMILNSPYAAAYKKNFSIFFKKT
jgi:hypothetical protein